MTDFYIHRSLNRLIWNHNWWKLCYHICFNSIVRLKFVNWLVLYNIRCLIIWISIWLNNIQFYYQVIGMNISNYNVSMFLYSSFYHSWFFLAWFIQLSILYYLKGNGIKQSNRFKDKWVKLIFTIFILAYAYFGGKFCTAAQYSKHKVKVERKQRAYTHDFVYKH